MPLDPRIALGVEPPKFNNPFEQLAQIRAQQQESQIRQQQIQSQKIALSEQQQKIAEDDAFKQAVSASAGMTSDQFLENVRQHAPGSFLATQKAVQDAADKAATTKKAIADAQSAAGQAARHQQDYLGHLADQLDQSDYNPAVLNVALNHAVEQFPDWKPQADQIRQAALTGGKDAVKAIVQPLIPAEARKAQLENAGLQAELPGKIANAQVAQQVAAGTVGGLTPAQQATKAQGAQQLAVAQGNLAVNRAREGREAASAQQQNTLMGGTQTGASPALAPGQRDETYLKTLPTPLADKAKALVEGRLQLPTRFTKGDTYWQSILDAATKYDPSFDAGNYNARSKARADLTSPNGTGGKIINSLNTAIQHAGKLSDLVERLGNTNTPALNYVENLASKAVGHTQVTNFEAVQPQLMKEIERLWRGAGGAEGDIDKLKESLSKNMGIQQQREALAQFVGLMEGKLQSTETQRDNVLGPIAGRDVPVLFPQSAPILAKIKQRAGQTSADPNAQTTPNSTTIGRFQVEVH